MTKPERCQWCGQELVQSGRTGRPRQYCRQSCRQQAHLARKLAAAHRLGPSGPSERAKGGPSGPSERAKAGPDEAVVRRDQLTELQDRLYGLQAALEDVTNDLADADGPDDVRRALDGLVEAARPVAGLWITPVVERDSN